MHALGEQPDTVRFVGVCFLGVAAILVGLAAASALWTADRDAWKVWLMLAAQYGVPATAVVVLRRNR